MEDLECTLSILNIYINIKSKENFYGFFIAIKLGVNDHFNVQIFVEYIYNYSYNNYNYSCNAYFLYNHINVKLNYSVMNYSKFSSLLNLIAKRIIDK